MEPVIMALEKKYEGKVEFIIVDVDDPQGQTLAAEYRVDTIPAFHFIDKEGEVVKSFVGTAGQEVFEKYIDGLLKN